MDEFLDSVKTPILNQEVNNLNRPLANEEIETVIKCQLKKVPEPDGSIPES